MPTLNINEEDVEVEVGTFERKKADGGTTWRRGVNGDLNVDVAYDKLEPPPFTTGPIADETAYQALLTLCDWPNTVEVYGDIIGVVEASPIDCKVLVTNLRPMGGLSEGGWPAQATIQLLQT